MKMFSRLVCVGVLALSLSACGSPSTQQQPASDSGVSRARAQVAVASDGLTVEQSNVKRRVENDSKPGALKYLYVISPYSGQVLLYSTVKGKVTSSGKRLTPRTVAATDGQYVDASLTGFPLNIGGRTVRTGEVLEDDGTYGDSVPYIYWWDVRGVYHQHFILDGQIITISDQPVAVKGIVINLEAEASPQ